MSGTYSRSEKQHDVAGNPKTDIPGSTTMTGQNLTVGQSSNQTSNIGRSTDQSSGVDKSDQTSNVGRSIDQTSNVGKSTQTSNVGKPTGHTLDVSESTGYTLDIGKSTNQTSNVGKSTDHTSDISKSTGHTSDIGKSTDQTSSVGKSTDYVSTTASKMQSLDKDKDTKTSSKSSDDNLKDKTKNMASETYEKGKSKLDDETSMKSLLKHAYECLQDFMNPKLNVEKGIPVRLLSDAFGLVFLTEYKGSLGVGASAGTGVIISRKPNHQGWTGPCAIGMGGLSIGFQAGLQQTEHILVLRDKEVLKTFTSKNQLKLGGDISFAVGPLGRDASFSLNINDKNYAAIYSYSMAKGIHLGTSLEGQIIMIRDDCNENFYGKKVSAEDILYDKIDSVPTDKSYSELTRLTDEYIKQHGNLSEDFFSVGKYQQGTTDTTMDKNKHKSEDISGKHEKLEYSSGKDEKSKNQMSDKFNMDRMLRHARFTLKYCMDPEIGTSKQFPVKLLKEACGFLFLTEYKGGTSNGVSSGIGFIMTHKSKEDECSQPCAIAMGGPSIEFYRGTQTTEHMFIFRDEKIIKKFINNGQLNIGSDVTLSVGPLGRDSDIPVNSTDKGYSGIYSYKMSNGTFIGAIMENKTIYIRNDWNEEYFGKISANDILYGNAKPKSMDQKAYQDLVNLFKGYKKNQGKLPINSHYWNEQDRRKEEYWYMSDKDVSSEHKQSETSNINTQGKEDTHMYRLLDYARSCFENFVNPNLGIEKQFLINLISGARAVVFLTEIKAGLLVGASLGRGIILARKSDENKWTGPCAITLGGVSIGWLAGAEKIEHVMILREESVLDPFLSQGQFKLGGDISFAIGPLGRDANVGIDVNEIGYAPIYSYSMSKGAFIGTSLEGHWIKTQNDANEEYYGKKVTPSDILHGKVEPPKDDYQFKLLCKWLDKYIQDTSSGKESGKSLDESHTKTSKKSSDESHIKDVGKSSADSSTTTKFGKWSDETITTSSRDKVSDVSHIGSDRPEVSHTAHSGKIGHSHIVTNIQNTNVHDENKNK